MTEEWVDICAAHYRAEDIVAPPVVGHVDEHAAMTYGAPTEMPFRTVAARPPARLRARSTLSRAALLTLSSARAPCTALRSLERTVCFLSGGSSHISYKLAFFTASRKLITYEYRTAEGGHELERTTLLFFAGGTRPQFPYYSQARHSPLPAPPRVSASPVRAPDSRICIKSDSECFADVSRLCSFPCLHRHTPQRHASLPMRTQGVRQMVWELFHDHPTPGFKCASFPCLITVVPSISDQQMF